jgi:hypothetical protein
MGTQQILLIVLSVIIVGVAIAVGITMFRNQAYNSNAQQLAAEATNMRTEMVQYFKTPVDQGGAGATMANINQDTLNQRLGLDDEGEIDKENIGTFKATVVNTSTDATIAAIGVEEKTAGKPTFFVTFDLATGEVEPGAAVTGVGSALPTE